MEESISVMSAEMQEPQFRFRAIHDWYEVMRSTTEYNDIPDALRHRLTVETGDIERRYVYASLAFEYQLRNLFADAAKVLEKLIEEYPLDVRSQIIRAEFYLAREPHSQMAVDACAEAVEAARASGTFFREACGVRARLGLATKRYEILSASIRDIISYGVKRGAVDVGVERDFVDRAPPESMSAELRASYEDLFRSYWAGTKDE